MNPRGRRIARALAATLTASALGVAAYALWLFLFLVYGRDGGALRAALWVAAPMITGLGFASGVALLERPWERRGLPLRLSLGWPVAGCTFGLLFTAILGPMWIGMGLLVGGAASVAILVLRHPS